jgi:hypothetical protein
MGKMSYNVFVVFGEGEAWVEEETEEQEYATHNLNCPTMVDYGLTKTQARSIVKAIYKYWGRDVPAEYFQAPDVKLNHYLFP